MENFEEMSASRTIESTEEKRSYADLIGNLLKDNFIEAEDFERMISCVESGDNRLQQKVVHETFVFDDTWIYQIEGVLFSIEKISKAPKSSIVDEKVIVPVERAKKVNAETVRHLSSHTEYIRGFDEFGQVMPTKLLSTNMVEEKGIYENRFVYTLIKRLQRFVDERYVAAKSLINTFTTNILYQQSKFKVNKSEINYNLAVEVKSKNRTGIEVENNETLLEKIKNIKKRLDILLGTQFCRELSRLKPVSSPIMKTNLLLMNVDYKNCYKLYLYIVSYTALGYSVEVQDKNLSFDVDYFDDLSLLTALSLKSMTENNIIRKNVFENIPFSENKKRYKVLEKFNFAPSIGRKVEDREDALNQYYFDKIKDLVTKTTKTSASTLTNTKTINVAFSTFYRGLSKINQALYQDVLKVKTTQNVRRKPLTKKLDAIKRQKETLKRSQLLTRLMTSELNKQIKKEAQERIRLEKLNFEYEKMLLEKNKNLKKIIRKSFTDENKYADKKIKVYVGRRKIVNETLLDAEHEKQRQILEKQEERNAKRREEYRLRKERKTLYIKPADNGEDDE